MIKIGIAYGIDIDSLGTPFNYFLTEYKLYYIYYYEYDEDTLLPVNFLEMNDDYKPILCHHTSNPTERLFTPLPTIFPFKKYIKMWQKTSKKCNSCNTYTSSCKNCISLFSSHTDIINFLQNHKFLYYII